MRAVVLRLTLHQNHPYRNSVVDTARVKVLKILLRFYLKYGNTATEENRLQRRTFEHPSFQTIMMKYQCRTFEKYDVK